MMTTKKTVAQPVKVKWACPECGAKANEHGKGACVESPSRSGCPGFLCECEEETKADHGETFADPCTNAVCYHCGWGISDGGRFPPLPKKLQAWEKAALKAGWSPPAKRAKELGLE